MSVKISVDTSEMDIAIEKMKLLNEEIEKNNKLTSDNKEKLYIVTKGEFIMQNLEFGDEAGEVFEEIAKGYNFMLSDGNTYYSVGYLNELNKEKEKPNYAIGKIEMPSIYHVGDNSKGECIKNQSGALERLFKYIQVNKRTSKF